MDADNASLTQFLLRLSILGAFTWLTIKWLVAAVDPTKGQKDKAKLMAENVLKKLNLKKKIQLEEHELMIAQHLIAPSEGVNWDDVGGYQKLVQEIKDTLLLPLSLTQISPLLAPPKGVLLFGPPGCGKTLLAKAVAKSAGARFINLQFSTLTDKWYGESQKLTAAAFSLAKKLQPTIIFIDEIDSFLRNRESYDHEATAMMKAEFLSLWDGFESDPSSHVVIMGATNRPRDVDPAILRRMPLRYCVGLPTEAQRVDILRVILASETLAGDVDLHEVSKVTEGFSGSDLKEVCRLAVVARMKCVLDSIRMGNATMLTLNEMPSLCQDDLLLALEKYKLCKALGDWSISYADAVVEQTLD